ncbi:uncharacterized protein [Primulina huaijiensis]|uniref:uncharacterized protein n=1 Tax=Primulina huaijiensis TaxID=1492673 RepID=UPI003CC792F7
MVRPAAKLTGVPVIPGGIRGKASEHLPLSSSAGMPFSARPVAAAVTFGEEAAGEPMPRVVFQGVPTVEEAKEATSELIVGIERYTLGLVIMMDMRIHSLRNTSCTHLFRTHKSNKLKLLLQVILQQNLQYQRQFTWLSGSCVEALRLRMLSLQLLAIQMW